METLFHYAFLQRALMAGVLIAVACAVLGVYLILRRDAMIGHGLSHLAFAGVATGLLLNTLPLATALAVTVLAALGVMKLKDKAGLYGDTAIGIFSSLGLAVGILLASMSGRFSVELMTYLFGDVLAIEREEVWLSVALAVVVLLVVFLNYTKLLYMTFDRESARVSGIKTERLDTLLMFLTAVTVVLGMKIAGILLVAALLVIPAAAGLQIASNFKTAVLVSALSGLLSVVLGLAASILFDVPASAAIVILCFIVFSLSRISRKRRVFKAR
jgi:zinc transport system permease protein